MRRIAENAGVDGAIVVGKVEESKGAKGFNAATGEYEDLVAAGIIDPTKVVRTALQNAASIAGLLLTTDAAVTDAPEPKKAAPPMPAAAKTTTTKKRTGKSTKARVRLRSGVIFYISRHSFSPVTIFTFALNFLARHIAGGDVCYDDVVMETQRRLPPLASKTRLSELRAYLSNLFEISRRQLRRQTFVTSVTFGQSRPCIRAVSQSE